MNLVEIYMMESSLEIRKLPPSALGELVKILEYNESWKRLMAIVPKHLEKNNYDCLIDRFNPKYNSEHFRLIENASISLHRACTEILLDEWGTSDRVLPALGHLLNLLKKAELYRAADFVAVNLMGLETPERPKEGPAALISTTLPPESQEIESILDNININSSDIENLNSEVNSNSDNNNMVVPTITITQNSSGSANIPVVVNNREREVSDMMKFSSSEIISNGDSSFQVPLVINNTESVVSNTIPVDDNNLPDLSVLNAGDDFELPALTALNLNSDVASSNLPDFTGLISKPEISLQNSVPIIPHISQLLVEDNNIPSSLSNSDEIPLLNILMHSTVTEAQSSKPTCSSPLPNLSLNTLLPHFTYAELEAATQNFNETPHENSCDMEKTLDESNGRFLGCGAFGSVFLALGLLGKPIAVKKLYLDEVEEVNVDDTITKQFRNEVEVLSKYKHDNLLSICGYSCDGPTYCLMYDYISGGALNYRLEKNSEHLEWKDRLAIASGTADAVSYLHTAFNTPLIHRDIKTANILLDCANKPKLGDFGIIKLLANQNTTIATTTIGTTVYMAPEAHRSGDVSVKTDSFSFGVVILELLTSLPPLDDARDSRDLISHVDEMCEDESILPLLDLQAGSWMENEMHIGEKLYRIATCCLDEKRRRPNMVEVTYMIKNIYDY